MKSMYFNKLKNFQVGVFEFKIVLRITRKYFISFPLLLIKLQSIMKRAVLLLFAILQISFFAKAQNDTIRTLVITEVNKGAGLGAYVELTNMGTTTLDLSNFRVGTRPGNLTWAGTIANASLTTRLWGTLEPGKTFVIAKHTDDPEGNWQYVPRPRLEAVTDLLVYGQDPVPNDSMSVFRELWRAFEGDGFFVMYYNPVTGDSAIVDGFKLNYQPGLELLAGDDAVSGYAVGTHRALVIRKSSVKQGNPDWFTSNGSTIEESEWMPIHPLPFRALNFWLPHDVYRTVGNHGNFTLNSASFSPRLPGISIDFTNKSISVPWGILRDSIRWEPETYFNVGDGLAWHFEFNGISEDSISYICKTGDKLTMFAFGNTLDSATFTLNVGAPAVDMNRAFPRLTYTGSGQVTDGDGYTLKRYDVTHNVPVIDSIINVPFATNVDTLLKYIVVAPNATKEIVWVDGTERTVVLRGDKIKVTPQSGSVKEYFISVDDFIPSIDSKLSSITWPEIPSYLRNVMGWKGDTIPMFTPATLNYTLKLPPGTQTIPALLPKKSNQNATISVKSAFTVSGGLEDRTTVFTVTAQDGISKLDYRITFEVEIDPSKVQPFHADPIISQFSLNIYQATVIMEIANIGNQPLDLSRYLIVTATGKNPAEAIQQYAGTDVEGGSSSFANRYSKYVPGYTFANDVDIWQIKPAFLFKDYATEPVINAGDVFVMQNHPVLNSGAWFTRYFKLWDESDIVLTTGDNPWGATISGAGNLFQQFDLSTTAGFLFKILNDSIRTGKKGIYDPNDFELIDNLGSWDNTRWSYSGITPDIWSNKYRFYNITRKETILKGNIENRTAMGTNADDGEWHVRKMGMEPAGVSGNNGKSEWYGEGTGSHYHVPITHFMSTISSLSYIVSDGFSGFQSIYGVDENQTLTQFLGNIIKPDPDQTLEVHSSIDGSVKSADNVILTSDTLIVTSEDNQNITKYVITVVPGGLNSNAVLTSTVYDVVTDEVNGTGKVSGMNYGALLTDILSKVTKPSTAKMYVVDANDAIIPLKILNFDTVYVNTTVTDALYLKVIAQDGTTSIKYHLDPVSQSNEAFVISSVYVVDENLVYIQSIPSGTAASTFYSNIQAVKGASAKIVDKLGAIRTMGNIAYDDVLVVVSEDGTNTVVYQLGLIGEPEGSEAFITSNIFYVTQLDSLSINNVPENMIFLSFVNSLKIPEGASLKILNKDGMEKTSGSITDSDVAVVTSGNLVWSKTYEVNYTVPKLAYVVSSVYNVNNNLNFISGVTKGVSIVEFTANLTPAPGATFIVMDGNGNTITSGDLNLVYFVKVTSEDGIRTTVYSIQFTVSVEGYNLSNVSVYPNPASDVLYVRGLPARGIVTVTDIMGRELMMFNTETSAIEIPMNTLYKGLYILSVKDQSGKSINVRVVKK